MADKTVYVVAVSQAEADSLAANHGWQSRAEADAHLRLVQSPPTDPFYAQQYGVWACALKGEA